MYFQQLPLMLVAACLSNISAAHPTQPVVERALLSGVLGIVGGLLDDLNDIASGTAPSAVIADLKSLTATATPTSAQQGLSKCQSIYTSSPTPNNIWAASGQYVANGLVSGNVESLVSYLEGGLTGEDSTNNVNTRKPSITVYPKASRSDAPYDLSEAALRAAIYIPSTFQYGKKGAPQPIILVPGSGNTGYQTFSGNLIPLLQGSTIADPVWLNIPLQLLNDTQTNAEYVAYAINYIYGISNQRQIAVASWSQGGIISQWAYKYWPSTRSHVTDQIAYSPDYHGTVEANFIEIPGEPLAPAVLQQEYNSNFITTLRNNNGDSSYVPTTTIYSGFFDEIVEPQQGTGASAYLLNARNAGVSNNEVQTVCSGQPAGTFYTHEGALYNNLGFALLKDALSHSGPGETSRLDLSTVCASYLATGLTLADFLLTENAILISAVSLLLYPNPTSTEPAIKSYAA